MKTTARVKKNGSGVTLAAVPFLDRQLTAAEFAGWVGEDVGWVKRRLNVLPGVITEGRQHVRIIPRLYLESRARIGAALRGRRFVSCGKPFEPGRVQRRKAGPLAGTK